MVTLRKVGGVKFDKRDFFSTFVVNFIKICS